ncbi:hypothetical protein ACTFQC_01095 [Aliivibrio fischeri]|uniref:hypothetical protein n=1 Tax=Aliivibrio fischeri TaxID=668 RepID=UPI003F75B96B
MAITTNLNVFCNKCKKNMDVSFEDISYDEERTDDNMGRRSEFFGEAEFECLTEGCNNEITIEHNSRNTLKAVLLMGIY